MLDSIPLIGKEPFRWDFITKSTLALTPLIVMAIIFMLASRAQTGYMIGTFDVVITHFQANSSIYSPLFPILNRFFYDRLNFVDYNIYFALMAIVISIMAPFMLLYRITGGYRYPIVFLYATAIPIFNLINGTLPQAIVIDFMLLYIAFPKGFWAFLILAGLTHAFGIPAMVITWLWTKWAGWKNV